MVWKPLALSPSAGAHLPPLLISTAFTEDAYTIHLTDITRIWSETLDRRAIIRRSRDENTSIDPSNADQFTIFLEKVKLGLAEGKDTTLALTILDADTGQPGFVLNITVKLPGGLAPLEWPIRLSAAPQALMTSQLIMPLMRAQYMRMVEFEGLREMLREKDHVIQKVVDKLEASGTELGEVFPQAVGKAGRKVNRKKAEERVRGLGVFDMDGWKKGLGSEELEDTAQLIGEVFTRNDVGDLSVEGSKQVPEPDEDWWESIKGITINLSSGKFSTNGLSKSKKKLPAKLSPRKEESFEEDAFQVQATPPHLNSPPKTHANDITDDDEDLDAPSQPSKIPDSFPRSQTPPHALTSKPKILGTIGDKKAALKPAPSIDDNDDATTADEVSTTKDSSPAKRTLSPEPTKVVARSRKTLGKIGGKKAPPPPPPELKPEPEPVIKRPLEPAKPKKSKLGQIGGKKKVTTPAPAPEAEQRKEASPSITTPVKRKLGVLGGHKRTPTLADEGKNNGEGRGRAQVKEERILTPPPRETSVEKADRKREALKRELEEKAKAPAKKKRKF